MNGRFVAVLEPVDETIFRLRTAYHEDWLREFKDRVPAHCRQWDGVYKQWYVDLAYYQDTLLLCQAYFLEVRDGVWEGQNHTTTANLRPGSCWATLHLLPTAPREVVLAVFRALALLNHPDVGGDTKRMQDINMAYMQIRQEKGWE